MSKHILNCWTVWTGEQTNWTDVRDWERLDWVQPLTMFVWFFICISIYQQRKPIFKYQGSSHKNSKPRHSFGNLKKIGIHSVHIPMLQELSECEYQLSFPSSPVLSSWRARHSSFPNFKAKCQLPCITAVTLLYKLRQRALPLQWWLWKQQENKGSGATWIRSNTRDCISLCKWRHVVHLKCQHQGTCGIYNIYLASEITSVCHMYALSTQARRNGELSWAYPMKTELRHQL